ncbi:MAG: AcrR family transcriptional regulator [Acidimicrobiales bacterium]|jgi:AcrR family transcriptional regulator
MTAANPKTTATGDATKARIVQATLTTLTREGVVGTSARAIARVGHFNQALIFYHFGSVANAIVAAVSEMGTRRMQSHQAALEDATTLLELVRVARELHEDDTTSENMTVLAQAFAGAAGDDEMGPKLYAALEPWSEMLADTIERVVGDSPIAQIVPAREIADAMSALFLGIELLDDLDPSRRHAQSMFDSMESLASLVSSILPGERP